MGELDGKVAIVTGAGRLRGIGRAAAVGLARLGADVVVTGTGRDPSSFPADETAIGWRDVESVADEFAPLVVSEAQKIRYGDPMSPDTDMGTVVHEGAAQLFAPRVINAVSQGASLLYGNDRQGALYSPTVLDHVPRDAELVVEETFGPPIPIIRVKDIDDAIAVDNGTAFGLSTGVCTNRWDHITRFVSELRTGTVNIWEVPGYRIEMSPFGGVKDSGLGYKEGVIEAIFCATRFKDYVMTAVTVCS